MQVKRSQNYYHCFDQQQQDPLITEPLAKRKRIPLKKQQRTMEQEANTWGFDNVQSEYMMNIVSSQLKTRLDVLTKEVMDLEWAKNLREGEKHDSRTEYLRQFANFWTSQEDELTKKIMTLNDDIIFWGNKLSDAKYDATDYNMVMILNSQEQRTIELLEESTQLQNALDFVKNDKGSLQEAMNNINLLRIVSSNDQQSMDLS